MRKELLSVNELGAGYYTSPIQQVRKIVERYQVIAFSGGNDEHDKEKTLPGEGTLILILDRNRGWSVSEGRLMIE